MISLSISTTTVYNSEDLIAFISRPENFVFLIIATAPMLGILWFIHKMMPNLRNSQTVRRWHYTQYFCYFLFIISKCYIVAYILVETDMDTVYLFANTLTAMSIGVTAFLSSGRRVSELEEQGYSRYGGQSTLTWRRGLAFVLATDIIVLFLTLMMIPFVGGVTIFICFSGGIMFGLFLLSKALFLLQGSHMKGASQQVNQIELTKEDYIIGGMRVIYVDFSFVLMLFLFVMLSMVKVFTAAHDDKKTPV